MAALRRLSSIIKEFHFGLSSGFCVLTHGGLALGRKRVYQSYPVLQLFFCKRDAFCRRGFPGFLHSSDHGPASFSVLLDTAVIFTEHSAGLIYPYVEHPFAPELMQDIPGHGEADAGSFKKFFHLFDGSVSGRFPFAKDNGTGILIGQMVSLTGGVHSLNGAVQETAGRQMFLYIFF